MSDKEMSPELVAQIKANPVMHPDAVVDVMGVDPDPNSAQAKFLAAQKKDKEQREERRHQANASAWHRWEVSGRLLATMHPLLCQAGLHMLAPSLENGVWDGKTLICLAPHCPHKEEIHDGPRMVEMKAMANVFAKFWKESSL